MIFSDKEKLRKGPTLVQPIIVIEGQNLTVRITCRNKQINVVIIGLDIKDLTGLTQEISVDMNLKDIVGLVWQNFLVIIGPAMISIVTVSTTYHKREAIDMIDLVIRVIMTVRMSISMTTTVVIKYHFLTDSVLWETFRGGSTLPPSK